MKLREALEILNERGKGQVKIGKEGGWTEYSIQYLLRHDTGELCWTAGGTTGGPARLSDKNLDEDNWYYFSKSHDDSSIVE
jgi:hypothetical protein